MSKWQRENKERLRAYQLKYEADNPDKIAQWKRNSRIRKGLSPEPRTLLTKEEKRENERKCSKRYYKEHREKCLKYDKIYYQKNKERKRIYLKEWRKRNPDRVKMYSKTAKLKLISL